MSRFLFSTSERVSVKSATLWLLFLGPFFFIVYGASNWLTAMRPGVGSFYFEWERQIPVVPAMIVPYMSMDLFFCLSLFLCANQAQLHRHAKRIVLAISLSAIGFLLFPLKFGFPRPEVDGVFGSWFTFLFGFDQPFNQAPSLHISLLILVWVIHRQIPHRGLRWAAYLWFLLIGLSTLFTYQHHAIDLIGGLFVGFLCLKLIPEP